ncbi:putative phosphoribosyl-5-aminoimidazole carboxylase [Jaminaea rosea]|uniref:Phosphoribosylaminoimidazole carboxylase n=1 Tax=Jaminaea rosea TaxID=1569628 RepID=A0A316V0A2_9BASI|nr:putative phosphoribosyl-5-aminoimidazole carboxylase [Jaminaea rosea]PWN30428.1 putative phosphoribosyl-5-aminoimidazole carboxylase [Jaminaea rosea]
MESRVVGVLGAGQLGRMFVEAASRLNVQVRLLDAGQSAPAKQICFVPSASNPAQSEHVDGSFADPEKIKQLAEKVDVLTIEIEHVDARQLQAVLDAGIVKEVHPLPATIALIQDKYAQKKHLIAHGLPVADFVSVGSESALPKDPAAAAKEQLEGVAAAGRSFGFPLMLKSRTQAYDGKGNFVVKEGGKAIEGIEALGNGTRGLYAEKWAPFVKEVAVMVVRSSTGEVRAYPAVETVHRDNICHTVIAPLRYGKDATVGQRAREIAEKAVATFGGAGVFGVELFLMEDGELLINEIAPRPHNSGHYTIEAAETSQYENHLRAILGLPLGGTALKVPATCMVNILGLADLDKDKDAILKTMAPAVASLTVPGATVHLYGKVGCRKGRKMGHITVVAQSDAELHARMEPILHALETAIEAAQNGSSLPKALLPEGAREAAQASSSSSFSSSAQQTLDSLSPITPTQPSSLDFKHPHPLVGIIMGSDSDLPVMLPAAQHLKRFNVPFELTIVSAHRTPDRMKAYARSAASRGLRCIIAGAGGAAHLPGMVAAQTVLPVVGVPVKGSTLDGVDSLHSIVQMPRGIPVATVAINNSTNAGLLAIRILAAADERYAAMMQRYMDDMEEEVLGKVDRLSQQGWDYVVKK